MFKIINFFFKYLSYKSLKKYELINYFYLKLIIEEYIL